MQSSSNGNSVNQLPMFTGVNYYFWSLKMKTLFKSQELWSIVEDGFADDQPEEPDQNLRDKRKKDAKALYLIQQALADDVFPRIAAASTSKEAWRILKKEYLGDKKVITVRLQSLRREMENARMKDKESVQDYLSRIADIVQKMKSYGEDVKPQQVVSKVLRSLTPKYRQLVCAIEEVQDLEVYTFEQLTGSLQAYEERGDLDCDKVEEQAFQVRGEAPRDQQQHFPNRGRGRGRGGFRGSHGGRGRGSSSYGGRQASPKPPIKCYYCNKNGHKEAECWIKNPDLAPRTADHRSNYVEQEQLFIAHHKSDHDGEIVWYIDSGCSNHMTGSKSMFQHIDDTKRGVVNLGDGKQLEVAGLGVISVQTEQGSKKTLSNVQYVPHLAHNLLSVGQLVSGGYSVSFANGVCTIKDGSSNAVLLKAEMGNNKLFPMNLTTSSGKALVVKGEENAKLWHLRYGHLNMTSLQLLSARGFVRGLPSIGKLELCEGCIYGKQSRGSFPAGGSWRARECLELLHADLCGPMGTESLGGRRYFLMITDDFTRMSWVYFQKTKSEALENFKKFKALVENQTGKSVKALRTDRGGEFSSNAFTEFCDEHGIRREFTAPYTPEQNGVAERMNRTVVEMARSMLKAKNMPTKFWGEAVSTAVYILNVCPTKAVLNCTPFEAWRKKTPSVGHMKVFGCIAYTLVNLRTKLEDKAEKCIFVGYSTQSKAYRLYNPLTEKIIISRNVIFDEDAEWNWDQNAQQEVPTPRVVSLEEQSSPQPTPTASNHSSPPTTSSSSSSDESSESDTSSSDQPRKVRSLIDIYESCDFAFIVTEPADYQEAATCVEWTQAMKEEINAIEKNKTWELVNLPKEKNVIGLKWVYRTKYNSDGSISKHKARLVAKGYVQQEGVDYEETFSPVARFETVRIVLALAAQWKLPVYQLDVKSAFLNGDLLEEVFVHQPPGFVKKGEEEKVYKLKKALYGLKQAPRAWYSKIDTFFCTSGFQKSDNEPTLYVKKEGMEFLVVCLYVDDIILFSSSQSMLTSFKDSMTNQFEMTDLGMLQYFLGLEVKQGKEGTFLCQKRYALNLLKRFHMEACETIATPMNASEKLQKNDGTEEADVTLYRSMVGGLNYLTHSRPDLAYCVSIVSRYMQRLTKQHLGAARRILRYVAGTLEFGIWYSSVKDFKLRGYSDSDWAGCVDDRKSMSGSVFDLGSGAVTWSSKKQETIALYSSEAEYVAAGSAAKQALWISKLLTDLGCMQT
ncbi:unnamed protein product [Cuscuta epithymum]|uniref:Uncharacterized protein n=1 Tax=Cuscuta epithymum TaxID=186058 RepID=A0AAV0D7T7_9ASTE|nr:unnamed protein product [Cuscuta epithymum]